MKNGARMGNLLESKFFSSREWSGFQDSDLLGLILLNGLVPVT